MPDPFPAVPSRLVPSRDGTPIAVFATGPVVPGRPPLVLVHGTSADHRTWRVVAPDLARDHRVHALDRRGRGASGDAPAYAIERELEDLAAVAEALAGDGGGPVDVVGHSLGGRIALAAASLTPAVGRVAAYESAPAAPGDAGGDLAIERLLATLRADLAAGDLDGLLARFMTEAVGMPPAELAAFRADPIWPLRAAAGPTIVRELDAAAHAPAIALDALARTAVPVLQLSGSQSPARFRDGAAALDARLPDGRLVVIDGARHAAHHTHPEAYLAAVRAFLDR